MVDYVAKLRKEIAKAVRQEVNKVARTTGLAQSSIHGSGLDVYDEAGNFLTSVVTSKGDGGYGVGYNIDSTVITPEGIESPSIKTNAITADKLEAMLVLVNMIIAGDPAGACAIMDQTGFSTRAVSDDGTQYVSTRLGSADGGDSFEVISDPTQPPTAAISSAGDGSLASLAVAAKDITVGGSSLLGTMVDPAASPGLLDNWPRGALIYSNLRGLSTMSGTVNNTESIIGQFEIQLPPNRMYRFEMPWRATASVASGAPASLDFSVRARYEITSDGSEPANPSTSSPVLADSSVRVPASGSRGQSGILVANFATNAGTYRVKIGIDIFSSAATCNVTPSIYDLLSWVAAVSDTGPSGTLVPASLPGGSSVQQYTTVWAASDSHTWLADGTRYDTGTGSRPAPGSLILQGGSGSHGAIVFNGGAISGETGKTIAQAHTGATVIKHEIFLWQTWSEADSGQVEVRPWTGTTLPATKAPPTGAAGVTKHNYTTRSQGAWFQIPSSYINATQTGIWIASPDRLVAATHTNLAGAAYGGDPKAFPLFRSTYLR